MKPRFVLGVLVICVSFVFAESRNRNLIDISGLVFTEPDPAVGRRVSKYNPTRSNVSAWELGTCQYYPRSRTRTGYINSTYHWPNKRVPYLIVGKYTSAEMTHMKAAFNQFHEKTCIRFVPRTTETDYIEIGDRHTGCWSQVGRIRGKQLLNLQSKGCLYDVGTPVHELMHALGFYHQHSHSNRDSYVTVNYANIQPKFIFAFEKLNSTTFSDFGYRYDFSSVMHYRKTAFSKNGLPTLIPKRGNPVMGNRIGLTSLDAAKIKAMYKC